MTLYLRRRDNQYVIFNELLEDDSVWHMDNPGAKQYQIPGKLTGIACNADLAHQKQVMPRTCTICNLGPCRRYPLKPEEAKPSRPIRTLILSPFAGDYVRNKAYAQAAMLDSLRRGEAPFLSHLLYPQVLIDGMPEERETGLRCEHSWLEVAEQVIAYTDLGWSDGMRKAADAWHKRMSNADAVCRKLGYPWSGENEL